MITEVQALSDNRFRLTFASGGSIVVLSASTTSAYFND